MRGYRRTPSIVWVPFVMSVGTLSWLIFAGALGLLAAIILLPALQDVREAEAQRNDVQASVALLDQKIELQKQFLAAAEDPLVQQRLASRAMILHPKGQELLPLESTALQRDRSLETLVAQRLTPVAPAPVAPLPWWLAAAGTKALRPMLLVIALGGLLVSFLLGMKVERPPVM